MGYMFTTPSFSASLICCRGPFSPVLCINHKGSLVSTRSKGGYSPTLNGKLGALISRTVQQTTRICTFVPSILTN